MDEARRRMYRTPAGLTEHIEIGVKMTTIKNEALFWGVNKKKGIYHFLGNTTYTIYASHLTLGYVASVLQFL